MTQQTIAIRETSPAKAQGPRECVSIETPIGLLVIEGHEEAITRIDLPVGKTRPVRSSRATTSSSSKTRPVGGALACAVSQLEEYFEGRQRFRPATGARRNAFPKLRVGDTGRDPLRRDDQLRRARADGGTSHRVSRGGPGQRGKSDPHSASLSPGRGQRRRDWRLRGRALDEALLARAREPQRRSGTRSRRDSLRPPHSRVRSSPSPARGRRGRDPLAHREATRPPNACSTERRRALPPGRTRGSPRQSRSRS